MNRGAQRSGTEARERATRAAELLARDPRVRLVYLFGSAAQAGRPTVRDLDLAILADPPLSLDELMRRQADLVAATGGPLDLVSLNDAPLALAHEVVEAGVCLHASDPDIETAFVTRTRALWWDFTPYREEQWRLVGERVEARRRGSPA